MKVMSNLIAVLAFGSLVACAHKHGHGDHHHHGDKGGHWKMMDTNGDDVVTKEEFEKASQEKFKKLDANGDGKITKEEKMAAHGDKGEGKKKACCH